MCRESEIVSSNECIVCLGDYSDDIDSETGKLLKEWIQCTNENCVVWMHVECADTSDENYVCCVCECIVCSFRKSKYNANLNLQLHNNVWQKDNVYTVLFTV